MIGRSAPRTDARDKIIGRTRYVGDLDAPGAWVGVTVRSPVSAGRIARIAPTAEFPSDEAVIVTGADLGERNRVAMVVSDMPFLATESRALRRASRSRWSRRRRRSWRARRRAAVEVEIDPRTRDLSLDRGGSGLARGPSGPSRARRVPPRARRCRRRRCATAAIVLDGRVPDAGAGAGLHRTAGDDRLPRAGAASRSRARCSAPTTSTRPSCRLLGCAPEEVIVRQCVTGGAFGGKEDFPSLLAGHAALLARACGHPVKMIYRPSRRTSATRHEAPPVDRPSPHRARARRASCSRCRSRSSWTAAPTRR